VIELLSAMNTGHDGSISTGHANSPADMLRRLETLVLTGMDIPLPAVRSQIASAIEIVVQLGRLRDKTRKVLEIDEVEGICDGEIVLRPLYKFQETEGSSSTHVEGVLVSTGERLLHREKLEMAGKEFAFEQTETDSGCHSDDCVCVYSSEPFLSQYPVGDIAGSADVCAGIPGASGAVERGKKMAAKFGI
jgi:hypothetical protein